MAELRRDSKGWVLDSEVKQCQLCEKKFSITFRRHHCRNCGYCVCGPCSGYKEIVPQVNPKKKTRVCYKCKAMLIDTEPLIKPSDSLIKPITHEFEDFVIVKMLGEGTFSQVQLVQHKKTKKEYAMKIISKAQLAEDQLLNLKRETEILSKLSHRHIISLHHHFEQSQNIYLLFDYLKGGELFNAIISSGPFSEKETVEIMKQILAGIAYAHSKNIAHRDLKPENLMLVEPRDAEAPLQIKIADWGLSKEIQGKCLQTVVGTPDYVAPEILQAEDYSVECDIWSAGVIFYVLLSGIPPFGLEEGKALFTRILSADYSFSPEEIWAQISEHAKDLIGKMLKVDPQERISAQEALKHSFFQNRESEILEEEEAFDKKKLKACFSLTHFKEFKENRKKA